MKPVTYSTTDYREQGELLKMLLEFWSPGGEFSEDLSVRLWKMWNDTY